MKALDPQEGADLLNALLKKASEEALTPKLFVSAEAISVWDRLTEEEKIRAEWIHPQDMPEVPGKIYCFNEVGFWFNC